MYTVILFYFGKGSLRSMAHPTYSYIHVVCPIEVMQKNKLCDFYQGWV